MKVQDTKICTIITFPEAGKEISETKLGLTAIISKTYTIITPCSIAVIKGIRRDGNQSPAYHSFSTCRFPVHP